MRTALLLLAFCVILPSHVSRADSGASFSFPGGRNWERVVIPGAKCGDGSRYSVFISGGDPSRLFVSMMGGGACWSFENCYFPFPSTYRHGNPFVVDFEGVYSGDPNVNPFASYSAIYFQYCNGDFYFGDHVATYGLAGFRHEGKRNIGLAVKYLIDNKKLDPAVLKQMVVYGYSAGALGLLYHFYDFDLLFRRVPDKSLLLDSPGLHFGPYFWSKLTSKLVHDYSEALSRGGDLVDPHVTQFSFLVKRICDHHGDWKVGVLQASRDRIMSGWAGGLTRDEHERLVYGKDGILAATQDPTDRCAAWVYPGDYHVFLFSNRKARLQVEGTSAMEFAANLVNGTSFRNFPSSAR